MISLFQQLDTINNYVGGLLIALINEARNENAEEDERRAVDRSIARRRRGQNEP